MVTGPTCGCGQTPAGDPDIRVLVVDDHALVRTTLSEHKRYLELLSDDPVDMQARQVVDMSTLKEDGGRRVGFRLFWG